MQRLLTPEDIQKRIPGCKKRKAKQLMREMGVVCVIEGEPRVSDEGWENWVSSAAKKAASNKPKRKHLSKKDIGEKLSAMTPMERALIRNKDMKPSERFKAA